MLVGVAFGAVAWAVLVTAIISRNRRPLHGERRDVLDTSPVLVAIAWLAVAIVWIRPAVLPPSLLALLLLVAVGVGAMTVALVESRTHARPRRGMTRRQWALLYVAAAWGGCLLAVYLGARVWPTGTGTIEGRSAVIAGVAAVLVAALPLLAGLDRRPRRRMAPLIGATLASAITFITLPIRGGTDLVLWLAATSLTAISLWYAASCVGPIAVHEGDERGLSDDEGLRAGIPYGVWAFVGTCLLIAAFAGLRPT